jgi:hypothetical protein
MLKKLFIATIILITQVSYAQQVEVKGQIVDSLDVAMPYASVVLLQGADSVIHQFGITNDEGRFNFKEVPSGYYLLQVSFVGYQDISTPITFANENHDFGRIAMKPKVISLDEFVVEENIVPIKIKGDTVEYNARAFETRPNAAVEELLKKLPGVQVDKDGNIKAQGEDVKKIFVDGKEFFGDDPKIATKNLPADAIDKVQVYDRKSDDAEFTGVDDGFREKAINLTLKEDKKNGLFGKVEGGYGTKDRFKGKANINKFDKKTQFSAIGMANNINEQGFSIQDYISLMGGLSNLMMGGGEMTMNGIQIQMPGVSSGISTNAAAGVNYNRDFGKKTELFTNYFFNAVDANIKDETDRNTFYEKLTTTENTVSEQNSESFNHRLNLSLRAKIDSLNELRAKASGSVNHGIVESTTAQLLQDNEERNNISDRTNAAKSMRYTGDLEVTHRHRFKKVGRSSVLKVGTDFSNSNGDGNLLFNAIQRVRDTLIFNQNINQTNTNDLQEFNYEGSVVYTEPLGKNRYLNLTAIGSVNDKTSERLFYDAVSGDKLTNLSRVYENTYQFVRGGLSWKKANKNNSFSAGSKFQVSELDGQVVGLGGNINKKFADVLPFVRFNLNPKSGRYINMSYQTAINAPTVEQLQPIIDNSNPQRLYQGNPDLKQEYNHSLNTRFSNYNQFAFSSFSVSVRGNYVKNKITNQISINDAFVQTTQPINTDENLSGNLYVSYSKEIKKIEFAIDGETAYTKGILFANNQESATRSYVQSLGLEVGNRKKEKFDLNVGAKVSENRMEYENNLALNNIGYQYNLYADLSFNITKKWSLDGSYDYTIYANDILKNQSFPMLKASISKLMFENDRGELKLIVFDALNRNRGISFDNNLNYTQTSQTNVLNRYFMVSFVYSLSKFDSGDKMEFKGRRR